MKVRTLLSPLYGVLVMALVLGGMNAQLVLTQAMLYITPATAMAAPRPDSLETATSGPRIIIPKINVDAPLVVGMNNTDESSVQAALESGVLHFANSPLPGSGNSVYVGHSSNSVWAAGNYKFVFALLEKLQVGDTFYLVSDGIRYEYRVSSSKVVPPSDVSVMAPTASPVATLITCTTVGTSWNRLVVVGEQISPVPSDATTAPGSFSTPQQLPSGL